MSSIINFTSNGPLGFLKGIDILKIQHIANITFVQMHANFIDGQIIVFAAHQMVGTLLLVVQQGVQMCSVQHRFSGMTQRLRAGNS